MNHLEWYPYPNEIPTHNADVLVFTKDGEIVKCRFMCVVFVETERNRYLGDPPVFNIVKDSGIEPMFVPLNKLKNRQFSEFHDDVAHWCYLPNMPGTCQ